MDFNRGSKWKKRPNFHTPRSRSLPLFILLFFLISLFFITCKRRLFSYSPSLLVPTTQLLLPQECNPLGERFMWYAPHSGFSNQLSEFRNAILMAAILNRTLVVPPVLDHHAVALGSCPKFRVLSPNELRLSVWNHSLELIRDGRYVSMADIIDLSSLASVRYIDFRVFVSSWCGVDLNFACSKDANTLSSAYESLRKCGSLLSGYAGNLKNCMHAVDDDCRTTVWTYQKDHDDGVLDSFQPDEQLKKKKKISFVRRRKDVYKALGPGSDAYSATVLAFGSLFTAPYKGSESYIDVHETPHDQKIQSTLQNIEFLPYAPEIISAGKEFALQTIKVPFLCAQLRLLDGQFKNHWQTTFQGLKQKLDSLKQKGSLPIHIFLMTDLPMGNWTGSYLGDLSNDSDTFKLFLLREEDKVVVDTAKKLKDSEYGMKLGSALKTSGGIEKRCDSKSLPDVLLYLEETVCSCASLGFVGTSGSTIAESIELMRKYNICSA